MELCFADVGQGSCNIILLGGRRAIVVDAGSANFSTVASLLRHFQIDTLSRLVITHNHDDHSRGAAELLTLYSRRIDQIWFLHDDVLRRSEFWKRLTEQRNRGNIDNSQLRRLERAAKPVRVYEQDKMYLDILAPNFMQNLQGIQEENANSTSGILLLKCGSSKVIFAGDSTIAEWREIFQQRTRPFNCDLLAVPHHAGAVWERQQAGEVQAAFKDRVKTDLKWLYTDALRAKYGIVSVGTNNQHQHPRPEVMAALVRAGTVPICTQMTRQCAADLESQRGRTLPLLLPSRSVQEKDLNKTGRSRNVPCAGTLLVELKDNCIDINRFQDHQVMIDRMQNQYGGAALCRAAAL